MAIFPKQDEKCLSCGSPNLRKHCEKVKCGWKICRNCRAINDLKNKRTTKSKG